METSRMWPDCENTHYRIMVNSATIFTFSLSVLLVLTMVLLITDGHPTQPELLNLTAGMYSACPGYIDTCPQSDDEKNGRMLCMFLQYSCPIKDEYYFCDIDLRTKILVEDCFPLHNCAKGSKNAVRLDLKPTGSTVSLDCVQCSEHRIQRQPHNSSQRFTSECDTAKMNTDFYNKLPTMYLVETRWPYDFDIYACDSTRGYSNKYKTSLCDANSFCSCSTDIKCTDSEKTELLPNGECDALCARERDPFKNFSCPITSEDSRTSTPHVTDQHHRDDNDLTFQAVDEHKLSAFVLVGISIGLCLVAVVAVAVALYCFCPKRILVIVTRMRECLTCKTEANTEVKEPEGMPFVEPSVDGTEDDADSSNEAGNRNSDSDLSSVTIEATNDRKPEKVQQIKKQNFKENNETKVEMHGKTNTYNHIENKHYYQKLDSQQEKEERKEEKQETDVDSSTYPKQYMCHLPSN